MTPVFASPGGTGGIDALVATYFWPYLAVLVIGSVLAIKCGLAIGNRLVPSNYIVRRITAKFVLCGLFLGALFLVWSVVPWSVLMGLIPTWSLLVLPVLLLVIWLLPRSNARATDKPDRWA